VPSVDSNAVARGHVVGPPQVVEAELFVRRMKAGRNRALVVTARGDNGAVDCVVKMAAGLEVPSLAPLPYLCEWIAAALAPFFGIRCAPPFEVIVTREFAESLEDQEVRKTALASLGSTFGSGFVTGFTQLPVELPDPSLCAPALGLLAFDAYIHNPDRRFKNPNTQIDGAEFFAFDHGDAFSFLFAVGGEDPVLDPLLPMLEEHALRGWVRGGSANAGGFREGLELLTDETFEAIVSATPMSWQDGYATGKLPKIMEILRKRRDAVNEWLPKVEAWLGS
jgi:hypothetical protein